MNIIDLLKINKIKYPNMQIEDAVKLIYQSVFCSGHLINDKEKAKKLFFDELNNSLLQKVPLFEKIGNEFFRMNLNSEMIKQLSPETLYTFFEISANLSYGTEKEFEDLLEELKKSELFDNERLCDYLRNYKERGYIPVSHSEIYKKEYSPSYRVVEQNFAKYIKAFICIDKLLNEKIRIFIAIDGQSGAGKTTFSNLLKKVYNANLIHTDDFFLRPEQRTTERLNEVGGNIDYERFKTEVIDNIMIDKQFSFKKFNCQTQELSTDNIIVPQRINIIEGAYAMHPYFNFDFDLTIFMGIDHVTQKKRITKRNGEQMLPSFVNKWIPMENEYIKKFKIKEKCMLIIEDELCQINTH